MATSAVLAPQISQSQLSATYNFEAGFDTRDKDDALVDSARMGDTEAFASLMERYSRFCLSKAYSILRNRGDAEDEVQNAWVQAWTHLGSYEGQGSFCSWLARIVSNQCLMRLRKAKLMPSMSVEHQLEVIDQRDLPEDIVGDGEVLRVLLREVRAVPPLLREVLVLRDLSNVAMAEIAGQLGISIPAVKSRLMRARLELRRRLEKHYGENGGGTLLHRSARRRVAYLQVT